MIRYLVIEDEESVASLIIEVVESLSGTTHYAATAKSALSIIESYSIDIALVDIMLPDMDGLELLSKLKALSPDTVFIMITSVVDTETIVRAVKKGASEYITKPFELSYLRKVLETYHELTLLRKKIRTIKDETASPLEDIIGESQVIKSLKRTIKEIAPFDSTVLLTGPTGAGKGLVAMTIHRLSKRAKGPFVTVDCPTIPVPLMESELFGHKRGAFTGATEDRKGLIEAADGGTLFIDEIGELPLQLQAKLLRVIDRGEFRKLGAETDRKVNVRVVAATNRNLYEMVNKGEFREDLFYRINVINVRIPPLSERGEDVLLLAHYFLSEFEKGTGKKFRGFTKDVERFIRTYNWPGNIREMRNLIERAVVMAEGEWIDLSSFSTPVGEVKREQPEFQEIIPLREFERNYIMGVLKATGGNKTKAAELLGITRKTLREKLRD